MKVKLGFGFGVVNTQWRGDEVGSNSLHRWVRSHLPMPELCEMCNKVPSYDLANVTGVYNRDFENWMYLCRRCHMISDGRMRFFSEVGRSNKNKPKSEEHKRKIREALTGKRYQHT